jgi:hypothetical protein
MRPLLLLLSTLLSGAAYSAEFYVATTGDDGDPGTIGEPFKTVDHGVDALAAGDTLYIRGGKYREGGINGFPTGGTAGTVTTITNYQNEEVIVNAGVALDSAGDWTLETGNIYAHTTGAVTMRNLSQNGAPLRLVDIDLVNGDFNAITGPGQWVTSSEQGKIWVRPHGTAAIQDSLIEKSTIFYVFYVDYLQDHITIDGIIAENTKYPYRVSGSYTQLLNCTSRNAFGDAIKVEGWAGLNDDTVDGSGTYWDSVYGVIDNCDIYNFGESGIDITGGDYWIINNNKMHDTVPIHATDHSTSKEGYFSIGLMTKNDSIGGTFTNNHLYNMQVQQGAMILGPNTTRILVPTASATTISNNTFENISGPWIISFSGAQDNTLSDNLFVDNYVFNDGEAGYTSTPETLIQFRNGYCSQKESVPDCRSGDFPQDIKAGDNTLTGNKYINNRATYIYREVPSGGIDDHDGGNVSTANIHNPAATNSIFEETTMNRSVMSATKSYDVAGASPPNPVTSLEIVQ